MRAPKPMMIYVTSEDETDTATNKLEQVVFASEKLAIGAKFFDTIKIAPGDASENRVLARAGKRAPRIVFLGRDYKLHKVLEDRRLTPGQITKAMSTLVRKEYVTSFNTMVKGYAKALNELDRLEARKTQLGDMAARLAERPNAGKLKKLERMRKAYEKDRAAWQARHDKLLELKSKERKPKV